MIEKSMRGASSAAIAGCAPELRPAQVLTIRPLQIAGCLLAAIYLVHFSCRYAAGIWLFDSTGRPIFNDFTNIWVVVRQVLHGRSAWLIDPATYFENAVTAFGGKIGLNNSYVFYERWPWPYPPMFIVIFAPFALLPYGAAFLGFQAIGLLCCVVVVCLIVHRSAAIALVLASPFNVHNVQWGQTGFLRTALLGAALLTLKRRPVTAGVFFGLLAYKPQFGILIPLALVAAEEWRALGSAAITVGVMVAGSIAAFGIGPWGEFLRALATQADDTLLHAVTGTPSIPWRDVQTPYGLVRALGGGAALAGVVQGFVTVACAAAVCLLWRSRVRYCLKAAVLSAATLLATPYAWAHDLTAMAVAIAFLAADQLRVGLLPREETAAIALFAMAAMTVLVYQGAIPLGPIMTLLLLGIILRRALRDYRLPSFRAAP